MSFAIFNKTDNRNALVLSTTEDHIEKHLIYREQKKDQAKRWRVATKNNFKGINTNQHSAFTDTDFLHLQLPNPLQYLAEVQWRKRRRRRR
uniref:Uncharacterized protein n=1 Tax=Arion vulgaris TaxID=1028688 RepID=A0A0B6YR83_9EUPU